MREKNSGQLIFLNTYMEINWWPVRHAVDLAGTIAWISAEDQLLVRHAMGQEKLGRSENKSPGTENSVSLLKQAFLHIQEADCHKAGLFAGHRHSMRAILANQAKNGSTD